MKNLLSIFSLSLLGFSHAYIPVPYQNPSSNPRPPQRKDIDSMGTEEFTLFVLAMQQWQKSTPGNAGGYFQVAGIHGAPHRYWDNANNAGVTSTGDKGTGYCFHGDQNFYLWHRPYLRLFEQQMRQVAISIASTWYEPQRATYQAAANNLRLPYWDWAKGNGGAVPGSIANSRITVQNPSNGQSQTIKNPLYSHTLVSGADLGDGIGVGSSQSSRTTYRGGSYINDMKNAGPSLKRNTALLFNTANVCWNIFATYDDNEHAQCTQVSVSSLESTHNTVHNTIGGTMVNLDVSAFDTIFWLHHCNVDRIGALWQAINPNTKIKPTYSDDYTFVASPGTRDETFQFLPFRKSNSATDWWRASQSYDTRKFGYTYPEIADLPSPSTVLSRVNAIYGNGRSQQALSSASSKRRDITYLPLRRQTAAQPLNNPPTPEQLAPFAPILISQNGSFNDYTAAVTIQKSVAPGTSFNIHLFFGDVTVGSDYLSATNRVGGFSVSQAGSADMSNAVTGAVPITDALLNLLVAGKIKDLKPSTIRKYVRARLVWRLVTTTGQDIGGGARDNGLAIKVQHTVVTPEDSENARPVVAAPVQIADTTDNTSAEPVPSGVAATTTVPAQTDSATATETA